MEENANSLEKGEFLLILVDLQKALCDEWEIHFKVTCTFMIIYRKDLPNVKIVNSAFEKLQEFDCMVSAANRYTWNEF